MSKKNYLSQNSKIKKMSGVKTFNWGIPAFRNKDGFATCPKAGICAKGCYAKQGAYTWSNVAQAFENRLALSQSSDFIATIDAEIKRRKVQRLRIHDSGDFYDLNYFDKWLNIIDKNPNVQFYAYTKMVSMIKDYIKVWDKDGNRMHVNLNSPAPNLTIIYSYGGKEDHLINPKVDRHSQVFESLEELVAAGYIDASSNDANALTDNHRVGLIYHGAKSKKWLTS